MTPLARSASLSARSFASAPRSLKEAVNWRFSNFRKTWLPVSADNVRDSSQGVATTCPRIASAALRMSWSVTIRQC